MDILFYLSSGNEYKADYDNKTHDDNGIGFNKIFGSMKTKPFNLYCFSFENGKQMFYDDKKKKRKI